jgi:F0F1-type ATP synthase delta subunit
MKKNILIYFDLITSLRTTQEVADFISEIDNLMLAFYKSDKPSLKKALDSVSTDSAKKIMQTFSKNNLDINDRDTVINFFETLKTLTKKFKVIKLVLAFNPTLKTISNIHNFVKDTLGIGYVFDIEVSEEILGGAIVIFDGKYNDFSLKKKIEDIFTLNNKEVLQLYK